MSRTLPLLAPMLALLLLIVTSPAPAAESPPVATEASGITVFLPNRASVRITPEKLASMPRVSRVVMLRDAGHLFEGVDLRELLKAAGVDEIDGMRGASLRRVIVAEGADGYRVAYAFGELDPSIGDKLVIVSNRQDDAPLPSEDGPWRLIVPTDKRNARGVRKLVKLTVTELP